MCFRRSVRWAGGLLATLGLLALLAVTAPAAGAATVVVPAGVPAGTSGTPLPQAREAALKRSGITVAAGDQLSFTTTGTADGGNGHGPRDADGIGGAAVDDGDFPNIVGPPASLYALVATIDDGTDAELTGTGDEWFTVGTSRTLTAPRSGELVFVYHDALYRSNWVTAYLDNSGSFTVDVGVNASGAGITASRVRVAETDAPEKDVAITFTRDGDQPTVRWRLVDLDGDPVEGVTAHPDAGVVREQAFAAGETTTQDSALVAGDTLDEADGRFRVEILDTGDTVAASAELTVLDDDDPPGLADRPERIAFTSNRSIGVEQIFVADPDGRNAQQVTHWVVGARDPSLSPAGDRVAFARGNALSTIALGTGEESGLATGEQPAWSPDGTRIAFSYALSGEIRVIDAGGSTAPVTVAAGSDPAWSPDSQSLAYVAPDGDAIDVIAADGSGTPRTVLGLSGEEVRLGSPAWSPGGETIAALRGTVSETGAGTTDLVRAPASGLGLARIDRVADGTATDVDGGTAYSPDGQFLMLGLPAPGSSQRVLRVTPAAGHVVLSTSQASLPPSDSQVEHLPSWAAGAGALASRLEPGEADFGDVAVGDTSPTRRFAFSTAIPDGETIVAVQIVGDPGFELVAPGAGTPCAAELQLGNGALCTIGVQFSPAQAGGADGLVQVTTDQGVYASDLRANAAAPPEVGFFAAAASYSEGNSLGLNVVASPAPTHAITVAYTLGDSTPNDGDYSAQSGTLELTPDAPIANVPISILDDEVFEPDPEHFDLVLQPGAGYELAAARTTLRVTIDDNDSTTVRGSVVADQDRDGTRDGGEPGVAQRRVFADADGDGAFDAGERFDLTDSDGDYELILAVGGVTQIVAEPAAEASCTAPVRCRSSFTRSAGPPTTVDFLTAPVVVSFAQLQIFSPEGDSGQHVASIPVTASPAPVAPITVGVSALDFSANDGDYILPPPTFTLTPQAPTKEVGITIIGDTRYEPETEFANLYLADGDGYGIGAVDEFIGSIVIVEDDFGYARGFVYDDTDRDGTRDLSEPLVAARVFDDVNRDGAYQGGEPSTMSHDGGYVLELAAGREVRLTIEPGPGQTCSEPILCRRDLVVPDDRADIRTDFGRVEAGGFSVGDAEATETTGAGDTFATHTVTLGGARAQTVSVGYETDDRSAVAPGDYGHRAGRVEFAPGVTSRTVRVPVHDDFDGEPDETYRLYLHDEVGAPIEDGTGIGTIHDDGDRAPATLSVGDATATEGTDAAATFTVNLSEPAPADVAFVAGTQDATATSLLPATAGAPHLEDYTSVDRRFVVAAGQTTTTVAVPIVDDPHSESTDQTFVLRLSDLRGPAALGDASATGTIVSDELGRARLSYSRVYGGGIDPTEGRAFGYQNVRIFPTTDAPVVVNARIGEYGANSVDLASDVVEASDRVVTIAPGMTQAPADPPLWTLVDDGVWEGEERVDLSIYSPDASGGFGDSRGVVDASPAPVPFVQTRFDVAEPATGTTRVTATIARTSAILGRQRLRIQPCASFIDICPADLATVGRPDSTEATDDVRSATFLDPYGASPTVLTFEPGEATKTYSYDVRADGATEPDEHLRLYALNERTSSSAAGTNTPVILDAGTIRAPASAVAVATPRGVDRDLVGSAVSERIRCDAAVGDCTGTAYVQRVETGVVAAAAAATTPASLAPRASSRLGTLKFTIPAGKAKTLRIRLGKAALLRVRKAGRKGVRVRTVVVLRTPAVGRRIGRSYVIRYKPAKPKAKQR